jgi:hypothetical protein
MQKTKKFGKDIESMTKQELIEEIELLIKANKDNPYCEFKELSNMIKKVCDDTTYEGG